MGFDADHGYGNALNVRRTIEELEGAGVSGLSIEDTELPAPFGAAGAARLISVDEGAGKMRAALDARQDPNLVIAGRTAAPRVTDIDDAIARAKAYEAAGVDAIFLVGIKTRAELEAIAPGLKVPLILGGTGPELQDLGYLAAQGVRIALQGHQPIMAAVQAAHATLKSLREGTPPSGLTGLPDPGLMKRLTRSEDVERWMEDYLG